MILLSILEYSPLANVAHISPVPVLNCELLHGPEPYREGVLSFLGSLKFSLENESKALNWSLKPLKTLPNFCGISWDESNFVVQWDDALKAGLFSMISLTTSLSVRTSFQRQNSSLCGFGEVRR